VGNDIAERLGKKVKTENAVVLPLN